jgi:hypothetical protein
MDTDMIFSDPVVNIILSHADFYHIVLIIPFINRRFRKICSEYKYNNKSRVNILRKDYEDYIICKYQFPIAYKKMKYMKTFYNFRNEIGGDNSLMNIRHILVRIGRCGKRSDFELWKIDTKSYKMPQYVYDIEKNYFSLSYPLGYSYKQRSAKREYPGCYWISEILTELFQKHSDSNKLNNNNNNNNIYNDFPCTAKYIYYSYLRVCKNGTIYTKPKMYPPSNEFIHNIQEKLKKIVMKRINDRNLLKNDNDNNNNNNKRKSDSDKNSNNKKKETYKKRK